MMDSWEQIWRRRGEMFAALGISSAFLWLSASVASPNSKFNIWPPLALCGLMTVAGLYMMFAPDVERLPLPGRSSGVVLRARQSRVYERHVDDLHAFAAAAFDAIHIASDGRRFPATTAIPFQGPGASDFQAHFPEAASLIAEWNEVADGYAQSRSRLMGLGFQLASGVVAPTDERLLAGVLERVGTGILDPMEVFWTTRVGLLVLLQDPNDDDDFQQVCPLPSGPNAMESVLAVWSLVRDFSQRDEAQDLRHRDTVRKQVRPLLTSALEAASKNHQPTGHCERCPQG
jgi:hypothetical protein